MRLLHCASRARSSADTQHGMAFGIGVAALAATSFDGLLLDVHRALEGLLEFLFHYFSGAAMTSFPVSLLVCSGSFRVTVVAALALVGCLVSGAAVAQTATPQALLAALKQGGLVVFMRHGETGPAYADRKNAVMGDCATQRNLDAVGRAQNVEMALALKALKVPAGPVWSSEFCRSWQTAEALFGPKGYTITDKLSVPPSYPGVNAADSLANNTYLKAMLADKPPAGSNTWLISHGINILLATGYHPGEQGEIVLFRPDGKGTYVQLGSIEPGDWKRLMPKAAK